MIVDTPPPFSLMPSKCSGTEEFFQDHPDLSEQFKEHLARVGVIPALRYLKKYYDFEWSESSLRRYAEKQNWIAPRRRG